MEKRPWQKGMEDLGDNGICILKGRALGLTEEPINPKYHMNPDFDYAFYLKELKELPGVKEKLPNLS